ncbi:MAG: HAMP domain-containing histidine kinase [Rhodococcus sp.]|nr:HAMP domain-containing histidine kinase [Rhodococcus sp. (in: high G+C Gram-positive bacteria)]
MKLRATSARTRIIGWVLLLVLCSLTVVTFVTWLLMNRATDERMRGSLRTEIAEFTNLTESGVDPTTGAPFATVSDVLRVVITYNLARPNEKFLGYVDGVFQFQSRQQAPVKLAEDQAFTDLVGSITEPREGSYDSGAGEVLYLAVPVSLEGQASQGVVVAAYFADQERESADDTARLMLIVGAVTSLAAAGGAWVVAGRILAPVRDIAETAQSITDTDLSGRIPESGSARGDEISTLVTSLNAMLDRVETGVRGQRRFVDDAGHELRTPITIVRGHLEVVDAHDPNDVRQTIALVDDELERMNRMVSDLLLLARAEQPEFVQPEDVDVAVLSAEIYDKVTRLADREWVLETYTSVHAMLDPQRITQAMVALADNASHHTSDGDRIGIGSQLSDGEIRFWVTDTGPGVRPEDHDIIFERFARGTSAAGRSDGAGLGLSIVQAIANAHGGRVTFGSAPGQGANFTIAVPAAPSTGKIE